MFDTIFYQAIVNLQRSLVQNTSGEALRELITQVEEVVEVFEQIRSDYQTLLEQDPKNTFLKHDDLDRLLYFKQLEEENTRIFAQLEKDGLLK